MKLAALCSLVVCLTAATSAFAADPIRHLATADTSPTAEQFARALMGAANQFGGGRAITNTHCAKGGPGDYMCSYAVVTPNGLECHLMHGEWTPGKASTITVVLSGRVGRCNSLRAAFHSLR